MEQKPKRKRGHGLSAGSYRKVFIVGATTIVLLVLMVGCGLFFKAQFEFGQSSFSPDSGMYIPAYSSPVATSLPEVSWMDAEINSWLSPFDSAKLRTATNAVNFVVVGPSVRYAANQTIQFATDTWEPAVQKPWFIDALSVLGTTLIVEISGEAYHLNVYQPFVWSNHTSQVWLVDHSGVLWTIDSAAVRFTHIAEVDLPILVQPNKELEISLRQ